MRTEDGHIIRRCLNGDSVAFGFLVDKYKASVYAFAYDRLRNFHDAEDVRLSKARLLLKEEMIAMMSATYQGQRLQATFTFRIVEIVKRLKIQPDDQPFNGQTILFCVFI